MIKRMTAVLVALMLLCTALVVCACATDEDSDKPQITYASWNLSTESDNNIERRMIAAFEELYDCDIVIEEGISQGSAYEDSITGLAARGKMPDVFMLSTLNYGLSNEYLLDLSSYAEADSQWDSIPTPIEEAVHYGSGIYAVPFAMHMMGYFVNTTLFDSKNIDQLEIGLTYEEFYSAVRSFSSYTNEGIIGLSHEYPVLEWYPAYADSSMGWYSWDGSQYNLDSQAFIDGMAYTKQLRSNAYTYDSLSEETRAQYFEGIDGYTALWDQSRLAIRWGYTYEIPDMLLQNNGTFDIEFVGVPGGNTPIVGDYLGISASCENPDLAYEFAKWMSFSSDGIYKRLELDVDGVENNTLPLTTDETVIDAYFAKYQTVDGLESVFNTVDNGIVEGVKVVPGYTSSRWNALTGISVGDISNCNIGALIDLCWNGDETYADYATQLNTLANAKYLAAIEEYDSKYQ